MADSVTYRARAASRKGVLQDDSRPTQRACPCPCERRPWGTQGGRWAVAVSVAPNRACTRRLVTRSRILDPCSDRKKEGQSPRAWLLRHLCFWGGRRARGQPGTQGGWQAGRPAGGQAGGAGAQADPGRRAGSQARRQPGRHPVSQQGKYTRYQISDTCIPDTRQTGILWSTILPECIGCHADAQKDGTTTTTITTTTTTTTTLKVERAVLVLKVER